MKLSVRTSAAQFLRQTQRHKRPRAGRVSQSSRPASHFLSRPFARGRCERGILSERTPSSPCRGVDDLHPRWIWRARYGQGEFDEREHPRAPAGRSDGGQFVPKNGGGNGGAPSQEFVVPKQLGAYEKALRAIYDNIPNRTTAELQSDLHDRTRELVLATTTEDREYAELWVHRLNRELQQRDFSDEKVSLAVKKRIWEAQRKYILLQQQHRQLNTWLEQSRHTIWKSSKSVRAVREKLAAVKQSMVALAKVTGAKLPHDNPIRNWTFEQKLAGVADRILKSGRLAPEIARQLEAAVRPENLARMGAMIALLAAAHAFPPAGLAADLMLLGFVGIESALIAHRLYLEVSSVQNEVDLNSAARALEEELASNAAGQLIQHLTGATIKGVAKLPKAAAKFNENYTVSIDRKKIRALANGSMPLTPNPSHLFPVTVRKGIQTPPNNGGSSGAAKSNKTPHTAGKTPLPGTRRAGVIRAGRNEVELVMNTGKGTMNWTPTEIKFIRTNGRLPDGIVGHHINSVAHNRAWAGDPRNIRFVRGQSGNLQEHGGNFRNPTTGPLIDRDALMSRKARRKKRR